MLTGAPFKAIGNAHGRTVQGPEILTGARTVQGYESFTGELFRARTCSLIGAPFRARKSRTRCVLAEALPHLFSTTTRRKPRLRRQGLQSSRVKWPSIFLPKTNLATSCKVNFRRGDCERQAKITPLLRDCRRARWPARKCTERSARPYFRPATCVQHQSMRCPEHSHNLALSQHS